MRVRPRTRPPPRSHPPGFGPEPDGMDVRTQARSPANASVPARSPEGLAQVAEPAEPACVLGLEALPRPAAGLPAAQALDSRPDLGDSLSRSRRKSRMVEISLSGSERAPAGATRRGEATRQLTVARPGGGSARGGNRAVPSRRAPTGAARLRRDRACRAPAPRVHTPVRERRPPRRVVRGTPPPGPARRDSLRPGRRPRPRPGGRRGEARSRAPPERVRLRTAPWRVVRRGRTGRPLRAP